MLAPKPLVLSLSAALLALALPLLAAGQAPAAAPAAANGLAQADIDRIQALRVAGKSDEAIAWLQAHPVTQGIDDRSTALRALSHYDRGRVPDEDLVRFRSYVGDDPYVLLLLGHVYGDSSPFQNPKLATVCYQRAAAMLPDSIEREFGLARAKTILDPTAANADAVLAFEAKSAELPHGMFARFASHAVSSAATALARKGDRGDTTLRLFAKARELAPNDPEPLRGMALTLATQGKAEQAEPILVELQSRFPECIADVFYTRAVIARLAGKSADALEAARNAYGLKADYVAALELAAQLQYEAGNLDEVRPLLERARRYANPSEQARMLFARYFIDRAQAIPATKPDGMDDKTFGVEQNKRRELLRQAAEESIALRNEKPFLAENLELLLQICSIVGTELDPLANEVKVQLAYAKKRAAKSG